MPSAEQIHELVEWVQANRSVGYAAAALAVALLVAAIRASRTSKYQNRGEAAVSRVIRAHFRYPDYHLMNHVTLRVGERTTEIDHILISRFGVYVVETKTYKGWLFGDPTRSRWTQVLFQARFSFPNPIIQNRGHVRAVQSLLDFLPPDRVKSVVVFAGDAEFKTPIPTGVVYLAELADYIRRDRVETMSLNRMQFCVGRLETARLEISGKTDVEHVQSLDRRYGHLARY